MARVHSTDELAPADEPPAWLDALPLPTVLVSESFRIIAVSSAWLKALELPPSILGEYLPDLLVDADSNMIAEVLALPLADSDSSQSLWVTLADNGHHCELRVGQPRRSGSLATRVVQLVSVRKRPTLLPPACTDFEPGTPRELMVRLAELPLPALFVVDTRIVAATRRAASLLRVDSSALRGLRFSDLLGSAGKQLFPGGGNTPNDDFPRPLPALSVFIGGSARAIAYCAVPLPSVDAELILLEGATGSTLDHASEPNRASYLIAGAAHEINNPLTFVAPALHQLKDDLILRRETQRNLPIDVWLNLLDEATEGVDRITGVVRRLRELREGRADLEPTPINDVIHDTMRLAACSIPNTIVLRRDFGNVRAAAGNRERLSQVVLNLILNAAHALSDEHGHGLILVRTWSDDPYAYLEVVDDGPGVPEPLRDRVFEPFFTTRAAGSGLGLALCRTMIRDLEGDLWLEPTREAGACFRIRLPLWRGAAEAKASAAKTRSRKRAARPTTRRKILLVDDDLLVRRSLARMLANHHHVVQASSVKEAVELAEHGDFEVLLTDLVMSHGGGLELIRRLEAKQSPLARQVIVISGMAPDDTPHDYPRLAKPCDPDDLLAAIERVAPSARPKLVSTKPRPGARVVHQK